MKWALTRIVFPLAFVLGGVFLMVALVALKPSAERTPPEQVVAKVRAVNVDMSEHQTVVQSTGNVIADQQVTLIPEVAGRVTWVADGLLPGARIDKNFVFARIDARPYEYVLRQRKAQLRAAELDLQLERERGLIAEKEWAMLDKDGEATELALRRPQRETVEAALDSATAAYEAAELDVSRTRLRAPFNAIVVSESVDVGQLVGSASAVATLVGADRMRVEVSVPVESLAWVATGASAFIRQELGDAVVERRGVVLSTGGQLDPNTRTATAVIGIDAPLDGDIPLLPGAFVNVSLEGASRVAAKLPREAVADGTVVWTVNADNQLAKHSVTVGWGDDTHVYVTEGLPDAARVVVEGLVAPLDGMPVELLTDTDGAAAAGQ